MRLPHVGDTIIHPVHGKMKIESMRGRYYHCRSFGGGLVKLTLKELLPMIPDLILTPAPVKTRFKVTVELDADLYARVEASSNKTGLSKCQVIRNLIKGSH